ncbi:hypothetical protein F0919_03455 [Taibaiella lutea]|uniref:Uncharacterized protein n=1 Tax=Taibaiella lutea TaxID=2608001 RepID=A0A5M6CQR8_9BACT|nr:hypothetical protein [Taibaiella lutea]KAA5536740.1 hypothetical protein F0919_03455 [Taibaiella lutea]
MNLVTFIMACFFFLAALVIFWGILNFDKIVIENEMLIVYSILGYKKKEIYLPAVQDWIEMPKKDKYSSWFEMTIYGESDKYSVSSRVYKNYDKLKSEIGRYAFRNRSKEKEIKLRNTRRIGYVLLALGVLILILTGCWAVKKEDPDLTSVDIRLVTDVLDNDPYIIKGSKGARSIEIQLKSYPEFTFNISGAAYKAMYAEDYVNTVKRGDSVFIGIKTADYNKKIIRTEPLNFWDKTIKCNSIDVIELADVSSEYLALRDYNAAHHNNSKTTGVVFMLILGLFFITLGLVTLRSKKDSLI